MTRSELTNLADHAEVEGAAFGIARLHSLYTLDTDKLIHDGIIEGNLNGRHIKSEPSVAKLSSRSQYFFNFL
jgi:hypothetical protein